MPASSTSPPRKRTIHVVYRRVGGWHVFTSDEVKGLYVAHKDFRTAYEDVAPTIEYLLAEKGSAGSPGSQRVSHFAG